MKSIFTLLSLLVFASLNAQLNSNVLESIRGKSITQLKQTSYKVKVGAEDVPVTGIKENILTVKDGLLIQQVVNDSMGSYPYNYVYEYTYTDDWDQNLLSRVEYNGKGELLLARYHQWDDRGMLELSNYTFNQYGDTTSRVYKDFGGCNEAVLKGEEGTSSMYTCEELLNVTSYMRAKKVKVFKDGYPFKDIMYNYKDHDAERYVIYYTLDSNDRIIKEHKINFESDKELITLYEYNEFGDMTYKKIGGLAFNYTFEYNEFNHWVKKVDRPASGSDIVITLREISYL